MDGAIETLKKEFTGLRTGRASPALLEPIRVEAYGNNQPLNQVANVSVAGPGLLSVQVWDKSGHQGGRDRHPRLRPRPQPADRGPGDPRAAAAADPGTPHRPGQDRRTNMPRRPRSPSAASAATAWSRSRRRRRTRRRRSARTSAKHWSDEVQKLTDQYIKQVDDDPGRQGKGHQAGLTSVSGAPPAHASWPMPPPMPAPGGAVPAHVAIIMDGNGRWAAGPRPAASRSATRPGAEAVRRTIEAGARAGRRLADPVRLLLRELAPPGRGGARR